MAKNIVVIGASQGIGREVAKILSNHHHVLAIARNAERLNELKSVGGVNAIRVAAADIGASNVSDFLATVFSSHFSRIDVLINCAGYLVNKPLLSTSEQEIEDVFKTNVLGLIGASKAVIPLMKSGGHIVNIGSMGGFQGSIKFPGLSVYSASKSAVAGFSECLAAELIEENIQVNCLAIGAAQTEMLAKAFPDYKAPLSAIEMANYIANFAVEGNKHFNGKTLPVSVSTP